MASDRSEAPLALRLFVAAVGLLGAAAVTSAVTALPSTPHPVEWTTFGVLALIAGAFALKIPGIPVRISVSDTFFIASAILFGPAPATVSIALDSLVMTWVRHRGRSVSRMVFNVSGPAFALWTGSLLFDALSGGFRYQSSRSVETLILPLACLTSVYYGLNSGLTAVAIALEKRVAPLAIWRQHFAAIALNYFAAASVAFSFAVVIQYASVMALAALLPLFAIVHGSMRSWMGRLEDAERHVATVDRLYLSTIEALSTAIEAKDGVTSSHIHRVQHYAMGLARAAGVVDQLELKAIQAAALLHDTGKLAVPERILNKPGKLTAAEFETMKLHVDVGADILSAIDFPYPVVPIVRGHHENWDGSGYPRGTRGRDIPLGARILTIVDCYDALTSDRPYRRALGDDEALAIIRGQIGTKYDPELVEIFERVHRDIAPPSASRAPLERVVHQINRASERAIEPEPSETEAAGPLHGLVGLSRVVSGRATPEDIAALAWSHVRALVPGSSCALFRPEPGSGSLVARFAAGDAAPALRGLEVTSGAGLSGWVAEHHLALVNSDARLELGDEAGLLTLTICLALPLMVGDTCVGVFSLYAAEAFSDEQVAALRRVAPHLAGMLASLDRTAGNSEGPSPRSGTRPSALRVVASR